MESIKFGNLLINFTTEFNWIWDNKGSPNASPVGFWRPVPSADFLTDYFPLGDYAVAGHHNINKKIVMAVVCEATPQTEDDRINGKALMPPDEFERVWDDKGSKAYSDGSIWRPIPPSGYVAMGLVASRGQPPADKTVAALKHSPTPLASRLAPNGVSTYGGGVGQGLGKTERWLHPYSNELRRVDHFNSV